MFRFLGPLSRALLRALLTKHEGWRVPTVVGRPASAPGASAPDALLDLLRVPGVAAELMQSHPWGPCLSGIS